MNKSLKKKKSLLIVVAVVLINRMVFAGSVETPELITGAQKLFNAATTWLLTLIPVAAGCVLGWHALQKALTDDDAVIADKRKKMKNTLIYSAVAFTAVGTVRLFLSFF